MSLTQQLPRTLQGKAPALAMNQIGQFGVRGGQATGTMGASFEAQYAAAADRVLSGTGRDAFDAIKHARRSPTPRAISRTTAPSTRAVRSARRSSRSRQLTKAGVGLEVAFAEVGGWDTHVNQGSSQGQLANRLDDFSRSLAALVTDLGSRMADTVILTMSEFGRAVGENGNRGTDHGHGNAMMVIGGGVRGGKVYGTWPGLAMDRRYEGRDLAVTTDFRDVFGEVVVRHLGVSDTRPIFPGYAIEPGEIPGLFG